MRLCVGAEEGGLRLVGQTAVDNWEYGRLEVFLEGSWGQVCDLQFTGPDAEVACRQLGFSAAAGACPSICHHDVNVGTVSNCHAQT